MGYPKLSIDRVIKANPNMDLVDVTTEAVRDHERTNGCQFEDHAARRALRFLRLDPATLASTLSEDMRCRLGRALEAMETSCAQRGQDH